jgi:regulatory protein
MKSFPRPSTSESNAVPESNAVSEANDQEVASVSAASREEQARAVCLRLLTARARTRAELAGQLTKRGYPDDVSDRVLDRLADVGLIDDEDFAEQWVRSRRMNAGKGKRALAAELRTKGVDGEIIAGALADIDAGAERQRAEQLVADKLRRERLTDEAEDVKVMRRLVGMLARRGYGQSMALDVVKVALAAERERRRV